MTLPRYLRAVFPLILSVGLAVGTAAGATDSATPDPLPAQAGAVQRAQAPSSPSAPDQLRVSPDLPTGPAPDRPTPRASTRASTRALPRVSTRPVRPVSTQPPHSVVQGPSRPASVGRGTVGSTSGSAPTGAPRRREVAGWARVLLGGNGLPTGVVAQDSPPVPGTRLAPGDSPGLGTYAPFFVIAFLFAISVAVIRWMIRRRSGGLVPDYGE